MALPESECTLWTKANDAATIITPEIGPAGTIGGAPGYLPGKFDDGIDIDANGEYARYASAIVLPDSNRSIFESYIKTDFNVVNGRPDNGTTNTWIDTESNAAGDGIFLIFRDNAAWNTQFVLYHNNRGSNISKFMAVGNWSAGDLVHIMIVLDNTASFDGLKTIAYYINGVEAASFTDAFTMTNPYTNTQIGQFNSNTWPFNGVIDNFKIYANPSAALLAAIIANRNTEGWPVVAVPEIVPTSYLDKKPKVLVLNSEIDLYALGYVLKLNKTQEKKTFQRDKVITNQIIIPVHNIDDQFNPDNPAAIFAGIPWRYQPVRVYDKDENKTWDGILDDFKDNQNGKKTGLVTKDSLLKFYQTKIEYQSADWETPGDSFRNICDDYGYTNYNTKYLEDSIAQYIDNDCYIKCNFNLVSFQQAIEKIAKYGAADCYSANNYLNFKLYIPFTGGVKFNLQQSDLRKNIKSELSRAYFNNYIIGYSGDLDIPTTDEDNNDIGLKSRTDNGNHDLILDGSDNQQIVIKDKDSAIFLGETHIRRSHVNLSTLPFPPLIITFSLSYDHKDFINLQTWFRMTNVSKGWTNKLFEVYINERDYSNRLINITAYEVDE